MPVRDIAALHGMCERSVYRYAARHGWRRRRTRLAIWQQTFREQASAEMSTMKISKRSAAVPEGDIRRELVARLWQAAAKQVRAVEKRLALSADDPEKALADIQLMALLSRSLQQLTLLDRSFAPKTQDDEFPQSDDALRSELLRKMDALIAGTEAGLSGEPDAG